MSVSSLNPLSLLSPMSLINAVPAKAKPQTAAATATTSSTSSGGGLTGSSTGTTFLNLLVKELQNQDPDSPVDSTQMVGQMISLNQLDQLISINQTLSNATTSSTSTSTTGGTTPESTPAISSASEMAQRAELLNNAQNTGAAQAISQAASDPTKSLDLSTLNIPNGGK